MRLNGSREPVDNFPACDPRAATMCAMTTSNDEIRQRLGAWNEPAPQPPIAPDAKAHLEAIPTGNPDEPDLMAWRPPRHRRAMAGRAASVRDALVSAGGIATRAELAAMVSERALRTAVDKRIIVSLRPGVYGLPAAMDDPPKPEPGAGAEQRSQLRTERVARARRAASFAGGAMSHLSAAEFYELPVLHEPTTAQVEVPRGKRVHPSVRGQADVRWRDLTEAELRDQVTSPLRTVLDCAADLPDQEALAVLDSALRGDDDHPPLVARSQLLEAADAVPVQVRSRVRRLVAAADGAAANPAESALRAIALSIPDFAAHPQLQITCGDEAFTVDVGDERHRMVLELDSVEWHMTKDGFLKDCARYTALVAYGWLVLRFTWDDVVNHPERTRRRIERVLRYAQDRCRGCVVPIR